MCGFWVNITVLIWKEIMEKTYRLIFISIITLLLTSCASPLKIRSFENINLSNEDKVLALLTGTEYDADIRISLKEYGFDVVKYASPIRVEKTIDEKTKYIYNQAEVRYGVSVYPGRVVDWCVANDAILLGRAVFEISDLSTNKSILFIQAGGWTSECGVLFHNDIVWDKLAKGLRDSWK